MNFMDALNSRGLKGEVSRRRYALKITINVSISIAIMK